MHDQATAFSLNGFLRMHTQTYLYLHCFPSFEGARRKPLICLPTPGFTAEAQGGDVLRGQ